MTTTPFPMHRRIPARDSPVDDNGAEEMLQDLMDAESKDSKAALSAIPGSEDLDVDDSASNDIEDDRSEVHARAIELPKNIATTMGYGKNPVIHEAGEVAFDSNAPDPGFEQGSIYRDEALSDAQSIIEQGANDTDADDGFDLMMEQASTENDALVDFEDALWEEDIDLLNPPAEAAAEKKEDAATSADNQGVQTVLRYHCPNSKHCLRSQQSLRGRLINFWLDSMNLRGYLQGRLLR